MTRRTRSEDESGAYLVLYALVALGVFAIAALVLDIAAVRQDRRSERLAADLAVTAAIADLDPQSASSVAAACGVAWDYVRANRTEGGALVDPLCSVAFPAAQLCDGTTPERTAVGLIGGARVEITNPVRDSSPLMRAEVQGGDAAQAVDAVVDGSPCQRMAVRIIRTRRYLFGGVAGLTNATIDVHSVGRSGAVISTTQTAGLVVLDPTACDALTAQDELRVGGGGQAGIVDVDSDGTGCGGIGFVIDPANSGAVRALASGPTQGAINSFGLAGPDPTRAFDPGDVASGRLTPQPVPALQRTGRAFVDQRYNCAPASCGPGSDHVDQLRTAVAGPGAPTLYGGLGFSTYADPCAVVAPTTFATGNWFVDCPIFDISSAVTFEGGTVVFAGGIRIGGGGCLAVNDGACGLGGTFDQDNVVYLRDGDLVKENGGRLSLNRTFAFLTGTAVPTSAGTVDVTPDNSGPGQLRWTAPLAGPFEDLALWSESGGPMALGGHNSIVIEGAFFAPNSTMRLEARTGGVSAAAQIVAGRVRLTGAHPFTLDPSPSRSITQIRRQVRLLR